MLSYLCMATKNEDRPKAKVLVESHPFEALFDTGSTLTLLNWKAFLALKGRGLTLEESKTSLSSATGDLLKVRGELDVLLKIGSHECIRPVVVVEGLQVSCIIGNDTMCSEGIIMDPARHKISIRPPSSKAAVMTASHCTIPPHSEQKVICSFSTNFGPGEALLTANAEAVYAISADLEVLDSVQRTHQNQVFCMMTNNSSQPIKVGRGVTVASAMSIGAVKQLRLAPHSSTSVPLRPLIAEKDVDLTNVPGQWKSAFLALVRSYSDIFSLDPDDVGRCPVLPHNIVLKNPEKVACVPPYRLPGHLKHLAEEYVDKLMRSGIIRASTSPFSSPLMLVKKPKADTNLPLAEQYRVVHDYRRVNQLIEMDSYPLRNIYELIDNVAKGRIWTVADLSSGFWNQILTEKSKGVTAFGVQGKGHYEYNRTPQGLASSPAAFQRLLDYIIMGLKGVYCYIDDVIVSSDSYEEHLKELSTLFARFRKYKLKLRLKKLQIAKTDINYLGYHISHAHGIRAGAAKIASLKNWPIPTSLTSVRQFIGLCSFFRRTIPNFASIASALTRLTRKDSGYVEGPLPSEGVAAFETLRGLLCERPCLRPVDFDKPFILTVDASTTKGLGALLSQGQTDDEHPCAYASRVLSTAERNYSSYMLELSAILFGVRHFRPYLLGKRFVIRTDHKPLTGLNRIQGQQLERMRMELADFQPFDIEYIPGEKNPSDGLSRHPFLDESGLAPTPIPVATVDTKFAGHSWENLYEMQKEDNQLKALVCILKYDSWPRDPALNLFCRRYANKVSLRRGVLCLNEGQKWTVWVPECMKRSLLLQAHDHPLAGHFGAEKTFRLLQEEWWWPSMKSEVSAYTRACEVCQRSNAAHSMRPAPLEPLPKAVLFNQRVHCDLLGRLPNSGPDGFVYLLVVTDAFSHLVRLIPLRSKTASEVSQRFVECWVTQHGVPATLVTDRGKEFDAAVFDDMCSRLDIEHSFSSAGHPQSNAAVERMNRTILTYFRKYLEENSAWVGLLPGLEFAYNTAPHSSTHLSPFVAAYGRRPFVPSSLRVPEVFYGDDQGKMRLSHMATQHSRVIELQAEAFRTQKATFDRRSEERILERGDVVYVTAPHTGTRFQKFQAPFMGPFTVMQVLGHNNYELWSPHRRSRLRCHINRIKIPPYAVQLGWKADKDKGEPTDINQALPEWQSLENSLKPRQPCIDEDDTPPPEPAPPPPRQEGAPADAPLMQAAPRAPERPQAEVQRQEQPTMQPAAGASALPQTMTRAAAAKSGRPIAKLPTVMHRALERKERADKGKPRPK